MASYTQVAPENITPGAATGWQEVDAGSAPASSVAEILAENINGFGNYSVGVRDTAEAVTKGPILLNEAEDGGGTVVRFLINVDGSGNVDLFRSGPILYYLVGYWEGVTWTDQWENTVLGAKEDDMWFELPAARLSLQTDRVHLITVAHSDTGKQQVAGVRTTDSVLVRSINLMEAEGGGVQCADWFVHTDAGDGNIEVYTEQYEDHTFYNQGYFDSLIEFTEDWQLIGIPTSGWEDEDLFTAYGVPKSSVCDFLPFNANPGLENESGVRMKGTADQRVIEIRESEGDGASTYGMSAQTDANGIVQTWRDPVHGGGYVEFSGYFTLGVKPQYIVGSSTVSDAISYDLAGYGRSAFYANGRFWSFWSDGTDMVFATSTDGINWSSYTVVKASLDGQEFSIWFDGTYVHYTHSSQVANTPLLHRRGTPNANGTISWGTEYTVVSASSGVSYRSPSISVDSSGYPWISYIRLEVQRYPYVVQGLQTDGSSWDTPHQLSTTDQGWFTDVIPLTNQRVLAIYAYNGIPICSQQWNGSVWGSEKTTTNSIKFEHFSAVAYSDDVYLCFLKETSSDIWEATYTYSTDSWGSEAQVVAYQSSSSTPFLAIDVDELYLFWIADDEHIYYKTREIGQSWSGTTDWLDESSDGIRAGRDSLARAFDKTYDTYIGLLYITNTASPYNVKFNFLTLEAGPPTISIFQSITITESTKHSVWKPITDALTLFSDVATDLTTAGLTEVITETIALADYVLKSVFQSVLETINSGDYVTQLWTGFYTMTESPTLSDYRFSTFVQTVIDTLNVTDYLVNVSQSLRVLIGTLTITGFLQSAWIATNVLVESLSLVDYLAFVLQQILVFLQAITTIDYLTYWSQTYRAWIETLTISDFFQQAITLLRAETTILSDYLYNTIGLSKIDTLSLSGYIIFSAFTLLSETISLFTDSDSIWTAYNTLIETLTLTDYLDYVISVITNIYQAINVSDYLTYMSAWTQSRIETVNLLDYLLNLPSILVYQAIDIASYTSTQWTAYGTLTGYLALLDYLTKTAGPTLVQVLDIDDYLTYISTFKRMFVNNIDITSYILSALSMILSESTTLTGYVSYISASYRALIESITLFTDLGTSLSGLLTEALTEAVNLIDYFTRTSTSYYSITDAFTLSAELAQSVFKDIIQQVNLSDIIGYVSTGYSVLMDTLYVTSYMAFGASKPLAETVNLVDYISFISTFLYSILETITLFSDISNLLQRVMLQSITVLDYMITTSSFYSSVLDTLTVFSDTDTVWTAYNSLIETITLTDYIDTIVQQLLDFTQSLDITEYLSYASQTYRSLINTLSLSDYYQQAASLLQSESIALSDYLYNTIGLSKIDVLAVSDYVIFSAFSLLFEAVSLISDVDSAWAAYNTLTEALTLTDYLDYVVSVLLNIYQAIDLEKYIAYISTWTRSEIETITLSDYLYSLSSVLIYQALTLLDFLDTDLTVGLLQEIMTEALAVVDYLTSGIFKNVMDTLIIADIGPYHGITHYLDLSLDITDFLSTVLPWTQLLSESTTLLDHLTKAINILKLETLDAPDYLTYVGTFYQVYAEAMTLVTSLLQLPSILMVEAAFLTDSIDNFSQWYINWSEDIDIWDTLITQVTGALQQSIGQVIALTDYLTRTTTFYRAVDEALTLTGLLTNLISLFPYETLDVSDYMATLVSVLVSLFPFETLTLTDYITYVPTWIRAPVEAIILQTYMDTTGYLTTILIQTIALIDTALFSMGYNRTMIDGMSISDVTSYIIVIVNKYLEPVSIQDYVDRTWSSLAIINQSVSLIDSFLSSTAYRRTAQSNMTIDGIASTMVWSVLGLIDTLNVTIHTAKSLSIMREQSVAFLDRIAIDHSIFGMMTQLLLESLNLNDVFYRLRADMVQATEVILKETFVDIFTVPTTASVTTKALTAYMYLKRITTTLVGELRTRRS